MRIAVDVCIGNRGVRRLREAGHEVVVIAEHAESDRRWFGRVIEADAEVIVSGDSDLEILCYDHRIRFIRAKRNLSGVANALRVLHKLATWAARYAGDGVSRRCRYCDLLWPGDDAITLDDLRSRHSSKMPICIKAPRSDRWFIDSGINGHVFESTRPR